MTLKTDDIYMFSQDLDLRYTWTGRDSPHLIGKTDRDVFSPEAAERVMAVKRAALAAGEARRVELMLPWNGDAERWFDLCVEPKRDKTGAIIGLDAVAVDVTRRKKDDLRLADVMHELTHRSKNLLAIVEAVARRTAEGSQSVDDFLKQFGSRLQGLAASHDLLVQSAWAGATVAGLVRAQMGPFAALIGKRVHLDGDPTFMLPPSAAQTLGMALHELAVLAAKDGALSKPGGSLRVAWSIEARPEQGPTFILSWIETGGPVAPPPDKLSFARIAIERNVARALDGSVDLAFPPDGLRWTLSFPAALLVAAEEPT